MVVVRQLKTHAVSIHAPVRERPMLLNYLSAILGFSIHAPVWQRKEFGIIILTVVVSIHAPVRERRIANVAQQLSDGFNSRSREGATRRMAGMSAKTRCFNSRSREGATYQIAISINVSNVSIHAPVRERLAAGLPLISAEEFQFTLP